MITACENSDMNKTFAEKSIAFHTDLVPDISLPNNVEWIPSFENTETLNTFSQFMQKYYSDYKQRHFLFGINPGRFGAGITGVGFTDPILLEDKLGIPNSFQKKHELSALFIHEVIDAFPSPNHFYRHFYITSINPVGLLKDGKNYNYYDDKKTLKTVEPFIIKTINGQLQFGAHTDVAFSIGKGKNYNYFKNLNKKHNWFKKVIPLPHPRWVMQYRRKYKEEHVNTFTEQLLAVLK